MKRKEKMKDRAIGVLRIEQKLTHYKNILALIDELDNELVLCSDPIKEAHIVHQRETLHKRLEEVKAEIKELVERL